MNADYDTVTQRAVALVRRGMEWENGADTGEMARRHGYKVVWTVVLDTGPLVSALIVAGAVYEHDAAAVVVPSLAHVDGFRGAITDVAALITPMQLYPHGHQWPGVGSEDRRGLESGRG